MSLSIPFASSLVLGASLGLSSFFFDSFESCAYQADKPLAGQDGWISLLSPDAATVVRDRKLAKWGRQSVEVWGGGPLETVDLGSFELLDGAYEKLAQFGPNEKPRIVRVSADVKLVGPDTGDGPQNDLLSANLYARNGIGRSAWFYLSSTGNVYCFANSESQGSKGYQFETPIKQGEYNHLEIILDYRTKMATFKVNWKKVGSLPFGGSGEEFRGALIEFAALEDDTLIDPSKYRAYWDNVLVFGRAERR